jgi:hypothetical protein
MTMDAKLIAHALALILDDPTIGEWATDQTDRQLGRPCHRDDDDDDPQWWGHYTATINELLGGSEPAISPPSDPAPVQDRFCH